MPFLSKKSKRERGKRLIGALAQSMSSAGLTDRPLPLWIRAPVKGPEYWTGFSRSKLYELAKDGKIRSVSIRDPGQKKGTRLFELKSILALIDSQAAGRKAA
jgi:hypothetical protein